MSEDIAAPVKHFIEQRIEADLEQGTYGGKVVTRFPPEPNGYLHVGHAKAMFINFSMAEQYQGHCHLRFDDTNPVKEDAAYMKAIQEDIEWLGFHWDRLCHAADYFEKFYELAVNLIKSGDAFVCSLSPEEIREYRGTLTEPGKESPYRNRSVEENVDLFARMRAGEFAEGEHVLRAKIDMGSGNINLRDPIIYRILKANHPHLNETWNIYPMYDFAHSLSDAIEGITHSLCSLEFRDHRPLYDWFVEKLMPAPRPQQIEFSRLNLSHAITSKRKLRLLVEKGLVSGWDDPRMPTLIGMRRRGFTPSAIKEMCRQVGVSKSYSVIDMTVLEDCVRDDLNQHAARAMCVLKPLKVVITSLPEDHQETFSAQNHPQKPELGTRSIPFSRELYIEQDDFMESPPNNKYRRLAPGKEVRLRNGYVIKCEDVIKDPATGAVLEVHCSHDPNTLGKDPEGRKVKGVIHWVSIKDAVSCKVRRYDRLFKDENPAGADTEEAFLATLNPNSCDVIEKAFIEPNIDKPAPETAYQFERNGYFVLDRYETKGSEWVFNEVVSLRSNW